MTDKVWCEHWLLDNDGCWYAQQVGMGYAKNFCPICGTPRPTEKKVELPSKIMFPHGHNFDDVTKKINQLIDFLASEPWRKP